MIKAANANLSDDDLRQLWRNAGGSFHGPRVETGTMPEADLLPFLSGLIGEIEALRARLSQAGAGGVVVKPLEFTMPHGGKGLQLASTALGDAIVWSHTEPERWFWKLGSVASGNEANEADAKKMLWLTYEARIRSALAASPSAGEPVAWRWKQKGRTDKEAWVLSYHDDKDPKHFVTEPLYATPPAPPVPASVEGVDWRALFETAHGALICIADAHADADYARKVADDLTLASLSPAPTLIDAADASTTFCVIAKPLMKRRGEIVLGFSTAATRKEAEAQGASYIAASDIDASAYKVVAEDWS